MAMVMVMVMVMVLCAGTLQAGNVAYLDNLQDSLFTREIKERSDNYAASSTALYAALDELNTERELASVIQIRRELLLVERLDMLAQKADADFELFVGYVANNREQMKAEGLARLLPLAELKDKTYGGFNGSLKVFLAAYREMLEFMRDNYRPLSFSRTPETAKYNELFTRYETASSKHNDSHNEWLHFVSDFRHANPEIRDYLKE
jgi:hypothetical protein